MNQWNIKQWHMKVRSVTKHKSSDPSPKALCNMEYPSETHLTPKSCEISITHNSSLNYPIVFIFCIQHDSISIVLCAKFQTDWKIETVLMDEKIREIWI